MKLLKSTLSLGLILGTQVLNANIPHFTATADAGQNQTVSLGASTQQVLLDGSGSAVSPDCGAIKSYKWYKNSDNSYIGEGQTLWYHPDLGFQVIKLVIETAAYQKDGIATCKDDDIVAITATNLVVANAGPDITATVTPSHPSVPLDGSTSTSGANFTGIASYEWFDASGNSLGTGATFNFTPPATGDYPITLTVTDTAGTSASDTVVVHATKVTSDPANTLQADAGPDVNLTQTPSHRAVHLDGSNSVGVNGITDYKWYDNGTYIGPHAKRWYVPSGAGVHDIKLIVIDAQGNISEDHMNLNVIIP